MSHSLLFRRFLTNPTQVGALCPSSPALCRRIAGDIGLEKASTVVELGPGTGAITREILKRLSPQCHFLAVELDPALCATLNAEFPQLAVHNGSAAELGAILAKRRMTAAEVIVSGLPWAIFPESLQREILASVVESLQPGGCFTTFAYLQGLLLPAGQRFRRTLRDFFPSVETTNVVWRNLPPAFIYRCRTSVTK